MYVYTLGPMDHGWSAMKTIKEAVRDCGKPSADDILTAYERALDAALRVGWDGDFAVEPRVTAFPGIFGPVPTYSFVWKQRAGGITFFVTDNEIADFSHFLSVHEDEDKDAL